MGTGTPPVAIDPDDPRVTFDPELLSVMERHGWPNAFATSSIDTQWTAERRNRRNLSKLFDGIGYVRIANPKAQDGLWKVEGARQTIYARCDLSLEDQLRAARALASR